jgi:arginyl-tRNA--protein-N-Asp/Glu arginylyltransferase
VTWSIGLSPQRPAYIYRPHCDGCQACISHASTGGALCRQTAASAAPGSSMPHCRPVTHQLFVDEHYALVLRYQNGRHPGGGMDHDDVEQYTQFLVQSACLVAPG